ncbi:MAG: dTMP kinase [Candidatus Burarchaeum sp.]|nr:dTMP kinase [Candidatus Burarchaeum sp.]MDO8339841.1 dTMP kinase [Candidatus Burarchaeum sp.]
MLVVFEGIDGSGKATQIAKLATHLKLRGRKNVMLAYPDMHGPLGRVIDELLQGGLKLPAESQFYLFLADIARDQKRLHEALKANELVVLDRYCFSTIAYQTCKGMNGKKASKLVESAKLAQPDLVILLDIDPKVSSVRKQAQRQLDAFEMDVRFQGCVRQEFRSLAKRKFLAKRWAVIDAMGAPDEVFAQVRAEIDRLIK